MRNFRQLTGMGLVVGALFAMACEESPVTPARDFVPSYGRGGGGGGGGKPGSGGPAARLSINDAFPSTGVFSDGSGDYVDGEAKVQVAITGTDFHFKPRTDKPRKETGTRSVTLTLPAAVGGTRTFDDEFFDFRVHLGLTVIPCGSVPTQTHGRFLLETTEGQAHFAFGVPDIDGLEAAGDPLTILRSGPPGGATSTWTITSTSPEAGYLRLDNQFVGEFEFPFEFTVTGAPGCPAD